MTYAQAIDAALNGDQRGFNILYEKTFRSKLYLAIQYMKDEDAAQDVLQETYLKAFSNLDKLKDPERFPAWLGQILANTAKNELARKKPMLFSELASDEDPESFEYQIEDDHLDNQPELAYTREETKLLVHELMDALSDEQRIAVLMFHIEGASIKEISDVMGCSENTVKSRLNYGRKNIKSRAEELQKNGYKLYSLAPIPLLLLLLKQDSYAMKDDAGFSSAAKQISGKVLSRTASGRTQASAAAKATAGSAKAAAGPAKAAAGSEKASAGPAKAAAEATGAAVKATKVASGSSNHMFLGTIAGKAVAAVAAVAVIAGSAFGISLLNNQNYSDTPDSGSLSGFAVTEPPTAQEEVEDDQTAASTEIPEEPEEYMMQDDEYPDYLEGALTKNELEFVLAYGLHEGIDINDDNFIYLLNSICQGSDLEGTPSLKVGTDSSYRSGYDAAEINRLISVFTDYRITEENDSDTPYGIDLVDDTVWMSAATLNFTAEASILEGVRTENEMTITYTLHQDIYDPPNSIVTDETRIVYLEKKDNGRYRIIRISDADSSTSENPEASILEGYQNILTSAVNGEYSFSEAGESPVSYQYFLTELNGDGIKDLVVAANMEYDVYLAYDCRVFLSEKNSGGYGFIPVDGDLVVITALTGADGTGFYGLDVNRGSGQITVYPIIARADTITEGSGVAQYMIGESIPQQFSPSDWHDSWDLSGLNE